MEAHCLEATTTNHHKPPKNDHKLRQTATNHLQTTANDHKPEASDHKPAATTTNDFKEAANDNKTRANNHKVPVNDHSKDNTK